MVVLVLVLVVLSACPYSGAVIPGVLLGVVATVVLDLVLVVLSSCPYSGAVIPGVLLGGCGCGCYCPCSRCSFFVTL